MITTDQCHDYVMLQHYIEVIDEHVDKIRYFQLYVIPDVKHTQLRNRFEEIRDMLLEWRLEYIQQSIDMMPRGVSLIQMDRWLRKLFRSEIRLAIQADRRKHINFI